VNLPEDAEYNELYQYFVYYGDIERLNMIRDKKTKEFIGMILLTYIDKTSFDTALMELEGSKYCNSIINVSVADDK